MASDPTAKRRASFARADRLKKEAAQAADKIRTTRTAEQQRTNAARLTKQRQTADAKMAEQKRTAEARKLDRQKEAAAKKQAAQQDRQKAADQKKVDQSRAVEQAENVQKQAQAAQERRRIEADLAAREKAQRADQTAAHRQQTSRLRDHHREESRSYRANVEAGNVHHTDKIQTIDMAERRDLRALEVQRRSLAGRVVGIVKRAGHYERQEKAITERHEADRMQKHRDHEALKERQFTQTHTAYRRQAMERLDIATRHRTEVNQLRDAQTRYRPLEIERRTKAITPAPKMEVAQTLKQAWTQEAELGRCQAR